MNMAIKLARKTDGIYRAWCPALPGCFVYGQSREEAMEKIENAIHGYIDTLNVALPRELARMRQSA